MKPRLLEVLQQGYTWKGLVKDTAAGLVVGVVAIPLAIAFAIASGVGPEAGLVTGVVAGFLVSLLGGSGVQIGGPTGAFIVVIHGVVDNFGLEGLVVATILAGVILVLLGLARLGSMIQFIPFPVLVGFTSGIAVIIFSSQVNDILGLGLSGLPADFLGKWQVYLENLDKVNPMALVVALGTVLTIVGLQRLDHRIPGTLVALVAATLLSTFLPGIITLETIGGRFGEISGGFPIPALAGLPWARLGDLLMPAFSIAMLAGIESLLSAVVADTQTGQKHDSNMELVAQGMANVGSALLGGIPATGALARTATNIRSGGRTPVAGIVHSCFLLLVLWFLSPLTAHIPMAALGGILATVAYNMSELHTFRMLVKGPRSDMLVLLLTFFLTVLVDLTVAIPLGILVALLAFIRSMSLSPQVKIHHQRLQEVAPELDPFGLGGVTLPEGVEVVDLSGPLFFGAAQRVKEELALDREVPMVRIVRLFHVPTVDASGCMVLRDLHRESRKARIHFIVAGARPGVVRTLDRIGLTVEMGPEVMMPNILMALERARILLGHRESTLRQKVMAGVWDRVRLDVSDLTGAIEVLAPRLPVPPELHPFLIQSLLQREYLGSTALGHGVAFPHPRAPILPEELEESISFFHLEEPLETRGHDGTRVGTLVFILSHTVEGHLKALSRMGLVFRDEKMQEALRKGIDRERFLEMMEDLGRQN